MGLLGLKEFGLFYLQCGTLAVPSHVEQDARSYKENKIGITVISHAEGEILRTCLRNRLSPS